MPTGARITTPPPTKSGNRPKDASRILFPLWGQLELSSAPPGRLKELNPNIRCISLQPDSPFHGIEGTKHLGSTLVPGIYDASLATRILEFAPKTPTTWRGAWRAKKACWWAFPLPLQLSVV